MISDMKKLLLFGNNSEKSKLMKILHKTGCVEVAMAKKYDSTNYVFDENAMNDITKKLTQIEFCFDFLATASKKVSSIAKDKKIEYKPVKTSGLLIPKQSLTFEEFANSLEVEDEVFGTIKKFEDLSSQIIQLKSDNSKYLNIEKQLTPYKLVPIKLNKFKDTKNVSIVLGNINPTKISNIAKLEEKGAFVEMYNDEYSCAIAVIILKENAATITDDLNEMEFTNCTLNYDNVAIDMINDASNKIAENEEKINDLYFEAVKYEKVLYAAQRLHDYYTLEARKIECEGLMSSTQTSYFMEAWVPADKADSLDKELNDSPLALSFLIREPQEGELVPTLCNNNEVVAPYESVTNMFSAPAYKEIDPNPFVAFFFFLFYGMMLSDAGYGVVLVLLTGLVLAITKPKKGQSNLIKVIFMGGISTMIWGVIFGSYFGMSATDLGIWCWFNPIEQPMMMLYLSLGMGIFQMLFGTIIKAYAHFKEKDIQGGLTSLCWLFLVVGVGGYACGSFLSGFPAWIGTLGLVLLGVGLVLLMWGGTLGKKGAGKVTGALSSLYDIINFFSDLMSYTRIFGLGLATAVIGMVFNQIGVSISGLVGGGVVGVIIIAIIAVIGHTFNIAINALGSYVHNSRLQFVEFFGKFYTGGGELFKPLGSEMKYYYINNEKTQEVK